MSTDIYLTADGDLALGQQATDKDGYLLYYRFHNESDPFITTEAEAGDVPIRDIQVVDGEERDLQLIRNRLMTENPDWRLYPEVGADLSDLIGLSNTPATAEAGVQLIRNALTRNGAFRPEQLTVDAVPVGPHTLLFDIRVSRSRSILRYVGTLDLTLGSWNEYEIPRN